MKEKIKIEKFSCVIKILILIILTINFCRVVANSGSRADYDIKFEKFSCVIKKINFHIWDTKHKDFKILKIRYKQYDKKLSRQKI